MAETGEFSRLDETHRTTMKDSDAFESTKGTNETKCTVIKLDKTDVSRVIDTNARITCKDG